ncbi:MAG: type II secretion system GspH family protein, partial [Lactobacillales bacterium]|nr:type II secretion system GspH family protein [Lactobacillales bacterium]
MRIKFPKIVTQKNTGQEKGRSMLEMLAVLAIIGILSIGGLAAYQYAITKYRANETIDELSKRFIDYAIAIDRDDSLVAGSPLNSDFGRITGMGYPVSATLIEPDLGLFTISLQMVPTNVCKQILRDYEGIPLQIETGTTSLGSGSKYEGDTSICNVDNNMMLFAFSPYADEWEIHDEETSATQSDTETQ